MRNLPRRWVAASRLDRAIYREIDADPGALGDAAVIVALAGVARGLAVGVDEGFVASFAAFLAGFVLWGTASAVVWSIGVRSFGFRAGYRELLRTLGFAASPLVWLFVCALPLGWLTSILWVGLHGLAILAFVTAVSEALHIPTAKALWVCFLALAVGVGALFVAALLLVGESASGSP